MTDHVSWLIELSIKPGELSNMKALMGEMIEATQANEPDTLAYEWHINDDGDSCHIYERYTDSAAVLVHLGTFGERFAERFLSTMDPVKLTVYGNVSDDARIALDGLGAAYHPSTSGFTR
jgi:quinol monooxygenase YgiN